jgi:hypothetical protein
VFYIQKCQFSILTNIYPYVSAQFLAIVLQGRKYIVNPKTIALALYQVAIQLMERSFVQSHEKTHSSTHHADCLWSADRLHRIKASVQDHAG